jgi:hypothetical protein
MLVAGSTAFAQQPSAGRGAIADTFAITTFIAFTFWIVDLLSQRAEAM